MAKKKMSDYELENVRNTINNLNSPHALMSTALAHHYLPAEDLKKFKNQKRFEMILNLCDSPEEIEKAFSDIQWDNLENACNILYCSGNVTAINLAPIQWWGSPHSQVRENDRGYQPTSLFSKGSIETEWLPRYFFNHKAYHNFSNVRISHTLGGAVVGKKIQQSVWDMLKSKGFNGSSTIISSAFCGIPAERKILDVCLVFNGDFEHIEELIESTNWKRTNSKEETLFALNGVYCENNSELKIFEKVGKHFKDHTFDFDQEFGKFEDVGTGYPERTVSLGMATLSLFIGTKMPENMAHIQKQVIAHYSALSEDTQIQTAQWFYNNLPGYSASDKLYNLKEIIKHSGPKTIQWLLHKIVLDQCDNNKFVDGSDLQKEMTELANVLKNFSRYKRPLLDKEFLNWVLDMGDDWSLSEQNMGDVQYLKSWCKYPETFLDMVTSHTKCSDKKQIEAWIQASKIRIELADTSKNPTTQRKRKI